LGALAVFGTVRIAPRQKIAHDDGVEVALLAIEEIAQERPDQVDIVDIRLGVGQLERQAAEVHRVGLVLGDKLFGVLQLLVEVFFLGLSRFVGAFDAGDAAGQALDQQAGGLHGIDRVLGGVSGVGKRFGI